MGEGGRERDGGRGVEVEGWREREEGRRMERDEGRRGKLEHFDLTHF